MLDAASVLPLELIGECHHLEIDRGKGAEVARLFRKGNHGLRRNEGEPCEEDLGEAVAVLFEKKGVLVCR